MPHMNDKIYQLMKKAGADEINGIPALFGQEDIENFAQLVIEECISACATCELGRTRSADELIRTHFGLTHKNNFS